MSASLYNSFLTGWILKKIDREIARFGFPKAIRRLLARIDSKLIIKNRKPIKSLLEKGRVIMISNHPAEADVLVLLASLFKRKDAYLIAIHSILNILPSLDKNIIPVYIGHRMDKKKDFGTLKTKILRRIHYSEKFDEEAAHKKNISSIKTAAKKINQGGLVIIFPMVGEENNRFMPGVGYMIKDLKKIKKTKVVMAMIEGTSNWDYLRIIPLVGKLMPRPRVTFSPSIPAERYFDDDARVVATKMETDYRQWAKTVTKNPLWNCK